MCSDRAQSVVIGRRHRCLISYSDTQGRHKLCVTSTPGMAVDLFRTVHRLTWARRRTCKARLTPRLFSSRSRAASSTSARTCRRNISNRQNSSCRVLLDVATVSPT